MGWNFAAATVDVLTDGLPLSPPEHLATKTFAVALHRGARFGAVLFLRRWRDGNWDSDTAITERGPDGWEEPSCGGSGWMNPYARPDEGWNGKSIVVLGASRVEFEDDQGMLRSATAADGLAARCVAALECQTRASMNQSSHLSTTLASRCGPTFHAPYL